MVAVKKVAAAIGLRASDILLLDTLAAFSQPQDWEEGQTPVVWPSNDYLIEQTGLSLSTLKRCARRLASLGLIAFRDSPNGKRWGYRDATGAIVEAYGFDLGPMRAQVDAYDTLAAQRSEERRLRTRLTRQITIARRTVWAMIERFAHGCQNEHEIRCEYLALIKRLPTRTTDMSAIKAMAHRFETLVSKTEDLVLQLQDTEERQVTPTHPQNDPHIQTTKETTTVSNEENQSIKPNDVAPGSPSRSKPLDPKTLLKACPEFGKWADTLGYQMQTWKETENASDTLASMVGLSARPWTLAKRMLGQKHAAMALALLFDKTHSGEVLSPNGYLKGMLKKASLGSLDLERSVFGRARRHSGPANALGKAKQALVPLHV